ncbi:GGDEF domain-containing protein [Bacillaceae bacterium SAS-127]|nr:GGDEF domain-containing protein [Bacillaceae bacterium SAS-127]
MMKDLVFHASLIISYLFIVGFLVGRRDKKQYSPLLQQLFIGNGTGLMGIVLMYYSIHISNDIIIDLRHLFIVIAALFGGPISAIWASVIIAIGRMLLFDMSEAAIVASVNILLVGIVLGIMSKWRWKNIYVEGLMMNVTALFMIFLTIYYLSDVSNALQIMIYHSSISIPVGLLIIALSLYLNRYNDMVQNMKKENKMDYLTGLNNVRQFDLAMNQFKTEGIAKGERLAVLFIDIDFFKKVNDTYGHAAGDEVLKRLSIILQENARSFDRVYRNGGEEFSVLLLDCPLFQAREIAERIRLAVERTPFILPDQSSIFITISIGLSNYPETTTDIDYLIKQADEALYEAKQAGRNRVCAS